MRKNTASKSALEKRAVAALRKAELKRNAHEFCRFGLYVMADNKGHSSLPFCSRCDAAALDASKSFTREFPSHNLYRIGCFYTDTLVLNSEVNPVLIKG